MAIKAWDTDRGEGMSKAPLLVFGVWLSDCMIKFVSEANESGACSLLHRVLDLP